ncbi:MAG TPA: 2-isopropylmalate synthase [Blastocatellia bacterium]|nr:2-isopropylmalate synthase [Blastocatellia bacterium]
MALSRVTVFDTTLRDGEQSPGCSMTLAEKLRLARQLDRLGVDVIEAGFPIASHGDFEAVTAIASELSRPIVAALARATTEDIERAWEAIRVAKRPRIHTFLATSDIHLHSKLKITREQAVNQISSAVGLAASLCGDVEFSAEDATRTEERFLCEIVKAAIEAGATTVNIPDTVGYTTPGEYARIVKAVCDTVGRDSGVTISVHCHNDLGLGVANSIAALEAGARQVECTINGIGERAGNASLEEIAMALKVRPDALPFETSIHTGELYPTSQMLSEIIAVPVQPNKAIVGRNAFAHEAGIHQDGVIKNPLTYEIMTPESVGVPESKLVLGNHSGRHALARKCEQLGHKFSRRELDNVYRRFIELADQVKIVDDARIIELIEEEQKRPAA